MLVLAHGWAPGEFSHPEGLALGGGRLFVADKDNNRIVALQPDTFTWLFEVGSFGSGSEELMCTPRAAPPHAARTAIRARPPRRPRVRAAC